MVEERARKDAPDRCRDERGMIAVWTAVALVAFIVILGIGVDFAGQARAVADARGVAAEAARAGGQYLEVGSGRLQPDVHQALAAANSYVAASEFTGSSRIRGGSEIVVEVSGSYQCQFLSIVGINQMSVNASAAADVKTTLGGVEQ